MEVKGKDSRVVTAQAPDQDTAQAWHEADVAALTLAVLVRLTSNAGASLLPLIVFFLYFFLMSCRLMGTH